MPTPTEESFLKDVANHQMTVKLDSGVYRHLRFAATGKMAGFSWFEIVTWPEYLAYSGDMGCFVFTRLTDMFEFFGCRPSDSKELYINQGYWAEKLDAVDRDGRTPGAEEFSPERFRSEVEEHFEEWAKEEGLTEDQRKEFLEELECEVLSLADDGEDDARRALSNFSHKIDGIKLEFFDTWEWRFTEYTYRYTWCCYALAWAIRKYEAKNESECNVECHNSAD